MPQSCLCACSNYRYGVSSHSMLLIHLASETVPSIVFIGTRRRGDAFGTQTVDARFPRLYYGYNWMLVLPEMGYSIRLTVMTYVPGATVLPEESLKFQSNPATFWVVFGEIVIGPLV